RHFREHPNDNVGLVPAVPNLAVDLDDPHPRGSGRRAIRELYPQLFTCPYVRARRGPHFHLICPDAPPSLTKLTVANFKGLGVNIELYGAPSCNIILPPSIHPSSKPGNLVRYTWWSSGRLLVVAYLNLVGMFGFKTNGAAPTQGGHKKDWAWLNNYRIDFRLLDFVKCWQVLGRYGRVIDDPDTKRVRHSVQCPWIDKHTDTGRQWTLEN